MEGSNQVQVPEHNAQCIRTFRGWPCAFLASRFLQLMSTPSVFPGPPAGSMFLCYMFAALRRGPLRERSPSSCVRQRAQVKGQPEAGCHIAAKCFAASRLFELVVSPFLQVFGLQRLGMQGPLRCQKGPSGPSPFLALLLVVIGLKAVATTRYESRMHPRQARQNARAAGVGGRAHGEERETDKDSRTRAMRPPGFRGETLNCVELLRETFELLRYWKMQGFRP